MTSITEFFIYWLVGVITIGGAFTVLSLVSMPAKKLRTAVVNLAVIMLFFGLCVFIGFWICTMLGVAVI